VCLRYQLECDELLRTRIEDRLEGSGYSLTDDEAFPASVTPLILVEDGKTVVVPSQFGMTPAWARDASYGPKYAYNGRSESILDKPTFRDPMHFRRGLVQVISFMENLGAKRWLKVSPVAPETHFYVAALYEEPNRHVSIHSHCLITTTPNALVAEWHDRMPVLLGAADREVWLDPRTPVDAALAMLKPCPPEWMAVVPYRDPTGVQSLFDDLEE
jgi:putative SOS response-associated peptidase YedK